MATKGWTFCRVSGTWLVVLKVSVVTKGWTFCKVSGKELVVLTLLDKSKSRFRFYWVWNS
eukprot:1161301-Pelagomonas_calceolata.AAC.14